MAGLPTCCSATDMGVLLQAVADVLSPAVVPGKTRFFYCPAALYGFPWRGLAV